MNINVVPVKTIRFLMAQLSPLHAREEYFARRQLGDEFTITRRSSHGTCRSSRCRKGAMRERLQRIAIRLRPLDRGDPCRTHSNPSARIISPTVKVWVVV